MTHTSGRQIDLCVVKSYNSVANWPICRCIMNCLCTADTCRWLIQIQSFISAVCSLQQEHARNACNKLHPCGHMCGGIKGEVVCLPCLHGCSSKLALKQDADDMCMICFTEALSCAPAIQVKLWK